MKNFLSKVVCDVYEPKSYEPYTLKCLPERVTIYKSCTNKKQYIDEIFKLYSLFKKAIPKDYNKYQYFWVAKVNKVARLPRIIQTVLGGSRAMEVQQR